MKISILTTLYFSSDYINEFFERSLAVVRKEVPEAQLEFIFVNDGSPDDSLSKVLRLAETHSNITLIDLSRNFGHHQAIMTGLRYCQGDFVFLIDCDLEESPELFEVFWKGIRADQSLDVVYGIQTKRKGGWFERVSGWLFYKLIATLTSMDYPQNRLTARVMTDRYVKAVTSHEERELDIWGIFALSGFKQLAVPVKKGYKGSSSYTFGRKLSVAIDSITALTNRPLYFTFIVGFLSFFFACFYIAEILYEKLYLGITAEGWASTLASIWLVGGMILLVLGIFGIYLSKMFLEIKRRPLSIVRKIYKGQD